MTRFDRVRGFADNFSLTFASVASSVLGIVSAMPELTGLYEVSGNIFLAVGIALTGVATAHVAVARRDVLGWVSFGAHLVIAVLVLAGHAGVSVELLYPLVTIVGASVMALTMEHSQSRAEYIEDERRAFDMEEERKDNANRRKIERMQAPQSVAQGVASAATVRRPTSGGNSVEQRIVRHLAQHPGDSSPSVLARLLEIDRSTVYRAVTKSPILHLNGKGVEVSEG